MKNRYKVIFSTGEKMIIKAKNFGDARLKIAKEFDANKISWTILRVSEVRNRSGVVRL